MPVKPFLMSDLRKSMTSSPAGKHRDNIGTGNYNRFNPLASKGRTLSVGKRLLSDDDVTPASPKMPRFDSNLVFEKLASQDKLLEEAKAAMAEAKVVMDTCFKAEESPLGNFFAKLSVAVEKIILHSEATKSSLVDLCKVPNPPPGAQDQPPANQQRYQGELPACRSSSQGNQNQTGTYSGGHGGLQGKKGSPRG